MKTLNLIALAGLLFAGFAAQADFSPAELLSAGQLAERKNDFEEAERFYKKALSYEQTENSAVFSLAQLYMVRNDWTGAHFLVRDHLKNKAPFNLDLRLLNADILRKLGDLSGALAEIKHVEGLRPGYEPAKKRKGYFLFEAGRYQEAEEALSDFLKVDNDNLIARQMRGETYIKLNKPQQAISDLRIVQRENPSSVPMTLALVEAFIMAKQNGDAESAARAGVKANQGSSVLWEKWGDALTARKDHRGASEAYKKVVQLDTLNLEAGIKLVDAYVALNMKKEAELELKRQLTANPTYERSVERLVRFYDDEKKFDLGGMVLQSYSAAMPNKAWVSVRYGKRLAETGNYAGAEDVLRRAIKLDKENSYEPQLLLSYVLREQGKFTSALAIVESLQTDRAADEQLAYYRGTIQEAMGRTDAAVESYNTVKPDTASGAKAAFRIATIERGKGNFNGAYERLKQVPEAFRTDAHRSLQKEVQQQIASSGQPTELPKETKRSKRAPASVQ